MQINWVTVAAQIINFLILIWLLQRVLYRPLTRALEAREEEVNRRVREADAARGISETEAEAHRQAIHTMEQERNDRFKAAEDDAEAHRLKLVAETRSELGELRVKWLSQLEDEKAAFLDRLRRQAGDSFTKLARTVLSGMADENLVDRIARVFARRLAKLDHETKAQLIYAAKHADGLQIISSFPLSLEAKSIITKEVAAMLESEVAIEFRENPDLECGVVLQVGSRHVGWTLGEHLNTFENDVARLLDTRTAAGRES